MSSSRVSGARGVQARVAVWFARRLYGDEMAESAGVYANHPRLARWFTAYNWAAERPQHISKKLLELAALKAATVVGCEFCMDIGSEMARRSGLSDAQLLALHHADASGLFDDDELLVIGLARAMSVTPPTVGDELITAVEARFGRRGMMELVNLVAWENTRARLNVALGIGAGGFSAGKVCAVPESARATATAV